MRRALCVTSVLLPFLVGSQTVNLPSAALSPPAARTAALRSDTPSTATSTFTAPQPSPAQLSAPVSAPSLAAPSASTPTATPPPAPTHSPASSPAPQQSGSGPWLGVLQASGAHAAAEAVAGFAVAELELSWSRFEPLPGVFDETYAAAQRVRLAQLRAAGLRVTLDVGMQYPPAWVFDLGAGTRFVNQYGDVWHGTLSEDVPNAVFDPAVREAEAAYIAHVAADLGTDFFAVRAGGLLQDELRYPPAQDNGHSNCYWAFDANAQAHSPVPGWRPGDADSTRAAAFLDYYLGSLTDFERWLLSTYRAHFPSAWLELLLPSWGLRPGDVGAATASNLDGSTPAAQHGTLEMGLDWARQTSAVADTHVMLYSTWLERGDDGSSPQQLAPAHYLATLGRGLGLATGGENASAGDSLATGQTIVQRVRSWGLVGLMWLDEPSLLGGSPITVAALSTIWRS